MREDEGEFVIERLIQALAAQVALDQGLAPDAAEAMSSLRRSDARWIFGVAGHLVHYGVDTEPLEALINMTANLQRSEAKADASIKPGDEVGLVGDLPANLDAYDRTWLQRTTFVVRYVGDDGTIDIQPHLNEDYVIETVPSSAVERR